MKSGGNKVVTAIYVLIGYSYQIKSLVELSREERRKRVLELHNQGKGTREISEILQMSFRDIGPILRDADKQKEADQERTRKEVLSSQAYGRFSKGMRPTQVAIELNIRSSEAIIFQKEYWEMEGIHELNRVYNEIKFETWPLIDLWRSIRAAGMGIPHVVNLLKVANSGLPTLEHKCVTLKNEVSSLEEKKRDLYNQATEEGNNLEYYRAACQRVKAIYENLQVKRIKEEALVRKFEKNNSEYVKIRKTVEEKVCATLSDAKPFLYLALDCLIESIKANPDKYSPLINENRPPMSFYFPPSYTEAPYGQQQHANYFDTKTMLADEAARMYEVISKELAEEILGNYTTNKSPQPSLPLIHSNIEQWENE